MQQALLLNNSESRMQEIGYMNFSKIETPNLATAFLISSIGT